MVGFFFATMKNTVGFGRVERNIIINNEQTGRDRRKSPAFELYTSCAFSYSNYFCRNISSGDCTTWWLLIHKSQKAISWRNIRLSHLLGGNAIRAITITITMRLSWWIFSLYSFDFFFLFSSSFFYFFLWMQLQLFLSSVGDLLTSFIWNV